MANNPEETIFNNALEKPAPAERAAYLQTACAGDAELRKKVEALLAVYEKGGSFLTDPAAERAEAIDGAVSVLSTRAGGGVGLSAKGIGDTFGDSGAEGPGTMIGRYKLLQPIGEGGFGTVFMAEQQHPVRRKVALKVIKLGMDTKQVVARFEAERQALAMMDHPNIARVLDGGATDSGRPYFVMELVNGVPVTTYCDANRLTTRQRLEVFVPICQAVQHAHQKGIIHRDLKPTNVLVTLHDGRPMPKVIDFGIAKATQARLTEKTLFTEYRQMIGTPQYMSPEQAEMTGLGIDTRSDVYSLGVLLYELLTGTTPLDAAELRSKAYGEMQRMIREDAPPSPSARLSTMGQSLPAVTAQRRTDARQLHRLIRGDLDWVVMKCLEKDRSRRYESASGLAADVLHYLADEPVSAAKPSVIYRLGKFARRYRLQVAAAAVVLMSLLGGVAATTVGLVRAVRAEGVVRRQKDDVTNQRDRAVRAEADAQAQRLRSDFEARRAQVQYANGLVLSGDAYAAGQDFLSASDRYAAARTEFDRLDLPFARLDLSLVRLYRTSPPPLWTAELPGGMPRAWVLVAARKEIVAACADGQYHIVDVVTGRAVRTIDGDTSEVNQLNSAKVSGAVRLIATGRKFIRIIDPATGAIEREVSDDRAASFCAVSPDGKLAVSGDAQEHGKVTFWETDTLKRLETINSDRPTYGVFSHDGAMVATDDTYGIDLWDVKTRKKLRYFKKMHDVQFSINSGSQASITFTPDDRAVMFTSLAAGGLELRSVSVASLAASTWTKDQGDVEALAFPPDTNRIITASADGRVRVFDASVAGTHTPFLTLVGDRNPLKGLAYIGDAGPRQCEATSDLVGGDQAAVIAVNNEGRIFAWPLPRRLVTRGVAYPRAISGNGLLYAGGISGTGGITNALRLGVCDVATGRSLCVVPADPDPYNGENATALSPDGKTLYTDPSNGSFQAIDVASGARGWSIHPRKDYRASLTMAISPDGLLLATNGDSGSVLILNARTGGLLRTLTGEGQETAALAFAPGAPASPSPAADATPILHGRHLIALSKSSSGANDCTICDWDLDTTSTTRRARFSNISGLTFSPDGKKLAAWSSDPAGSQLLDASTLRPGAAMGPFRSPLATLCFVDAGTGHGAWALAGGDKELIAIDSSIGKEELLLEPGCDGPLSSPDGVQVLASPATRINLAMPRLYRELSSHPSAPARAAWYAEYGLWAWTRELLERERAAGRDVPTLLWARSLWMCGDYAAARPAFKLAVSRNEVPAWYAELCLSVGDTPRVIAPIPAIPRMEERYKNRREMLGPANPETIDNRDRLIRAYEAEKRTDLALPFLREMLSAGEANVAELRRTDPASVKLADALATLGTDLLELNDSELPLLQFDYVEACRRAEPVCRECLEIRASNEPNPAKTSNARAILGAALLGQKNYAGAEPLLLAGYEGMKAHEATLPDQGKLRLLQSAERLARLYEAQEKTAEADAWKQKADILRSVVYPPPASP